MGLLQGFNGILGESALKVCEACHLIATTTKHCSFPDSTRPFRYRNFPLESLSVSAAFSMCRRPMSAAFLVFTQSFSLRYAPQMLLMTFSFLRLSEDLAKLHTGNTSKHETS